MGINPTTIWQKFIFQLPIPADGSSKKNSRKTLPAKMSGALFEVQMPGKLITSEAVNRIVAYPELFGV